MPDPIDRRMALALLGCGVLSTRIAAAQRQAHTLQKSPADYRLQFFSPEEDRLLDDICEMILPADEHSPGAHAAMVHRYIDLVVANSDRESQSVWRTRIRAVEDMAVARFGKVFTRLSGSEKADLVRVLAARAAQAATAAELFFLDARRMTLVGYYTSKIGLIDELGYRGNAVLAAFPGCPG